jgi:hypothetical protein
MDQLKSAYANAKQRCENPNNKSYINYGARGIQFKFDSFEDFKNCLGNKPDPTYTLERLDNNGHYEIGNVVWATREQQLKNRRTFKTNSSGIAGVHYKPTHNAWVARTSENSKRKTLYHGKDLFEACCARKHWENLSSIR